MCPDKPGREVVLATVEVSTLVICIAIVLQSAAQKFNIWSFEFWRPVILFDILRFDSDPDMIFQQCDVRWEMLDVLFGAYLLPQKSRYASKRITFIRE